MLSVVIPCLDERENLKNLIPQIISKLGDDIEILIIDGESKDGTKELVHELGETYKKLKYVKQTGRGFADALRQGLRDSSGTTVVTLDAENHDPEEAKTLIKKLDEGYDVVVGSRFMPNSTVALKKRRLLTTKIANKIATTSFNLGIKDTSSGFRAYRREILDKILTQKFETNYFSVQVELLEKIKNQNGKIGEVGVKYLARTDGESKYNLKSAIKDASKLAKIATKKRLGK